MKWRDLVPMFKRVTEKQDQIKLMEKYFWFIGDGYFLDALNSFKKGEGFGIEAISCLFHDEFEPWEDMYFGDSGVAYIEEQSPIEESIMFVMNYKEFYDYLTYQSKGYLERFPQDEWEVKNCLSIFEEAFVIG